MNKTQTFLLIILILILATTLTASMFYCYNCIPDIVDKFRQYKFDMPYFGP